MHDNRCFEILLKRFGGGESGTQSMGIVRGLAGARIFCRLLDKKLSEAQLDSGLHHYLKPTSLQATVRIVRRRRSVARSGSY